MSKFRSREEYERWKAEKMQERVQTLPEVIPDIAPEVEKKKTGKYIWLAVLVVIAFSSFIIYMLFLKPDVTWTDISYTNWELGFSMNIPEGWDKYDFTLKEKAMLKMENLASGGRGKILFALAPDNRRDTGYTMMYQDMKGIDAGRMEGSDKAAINGFASAISRQGYKTEQFEKTIAGIDIPFVRAYRGENIFIMGSFFLSPEKIVFVQFIANSDEYEDEFWRSMESFQFIEE